MRLGVKPHVFLARALVAFLLTYLCWSPIAPFYTRVLAATTQAFLHLTELSSDPKAHQVTEMHADGTAIFFKHRLFPQVRPPAIPAEWVQANLVLLIPLMLATPAASYRQRVARLALALGIAFCLQIFDLAITVKHFYSTQLGRYSGMYFGNRARWWYGLGDAFVQSMDTQLFPFAIWAGIHFRQLLGGARRPTSAAATPTRAERRRAKR